jgi:hypothetical protein
MPDDMQRQLIDQKRKVDFDTFDISVKELISMVGDKLIDIAPVYQRQFRWDGARQSKLIESVYLGIPIPSLFMATNRDSTWEVIDGLQRLSTIIHFAGDDEIRAMLGLTGSLILENLDKLEAFNGKRFVDLPQDIQRQFKLKPLKVTTLSDKSDRKVRFDLFERLNTGGVELTPQEIRSCVFRGRFNMFLRDMAITPAFGKVVNLRKRQANDGTQEEFVLRFFAYYHRYKKFDHSVVDFLNDYMRDASENFDYALNQQLFTKTFEELESLFPKGITRLTRRTTPTNLYEAVAVGAALALKTKQRLDPTKRVNWVHSVELQKLTTGATNSRAMVTRRIEYCRDKFVGR